MGLIRRAIRAAAAARSGVKAPRRSVLKSRNRMSLARVRGRTMVR